MINEIRKFITRSFNSDASILIFYKEIEKDTYPDKNQDYLVIKKKALAIPNEESLFADEINFVLDINGTRKTWEISYKSICADETKGMLTSSDEDISMFLNLIQPNQFDLKNYYKILQKQDFVLQFYNRIFEYDHYRWLQKDFYGLVIEQKDFSWKDSDYGSDNTQIYIFANSKYFRFRFCSVFSYHIKPRDFTVGIFDEMKELSEKVYEYFFENKKYILTNFDEHELEFNSSAYFDNRGHILSDKKYVLPQEFVSDLFIVSSQMNNQKL